MATGAPRDMESYEIGYRDGESSAHADWRIALDDILPDECWVTRSTEFACTEAIGGTFGNGAIWTEEMCCLPCRIQKVLDHG